MRGRLIGRVVHCWMSSLDIDRQPSLEWPAAPVPAWPTHATLSGAVQQCRACELWEGATHAVIGQGAVHARVMLVAEHPGDREDIEGQPLRGARGGCSITDSSGPESLEVTRTSRTSSSTSATRLAASAGFTSDPIAVRSRRACRGSKPRSGDQARGARVPWRDGGAGPARLGCAHRA